MLIINRVCLIATFVVFIHTTLKSQTPSTCFEIESILVDACDPNNIEGANEMVRFIVGPNDLSTSNLSINWPNNSFLGTCKSATTASKVASLNASITGCGFLKEPTANTLPSGAKVMFLTSTDFNVSANSSANLNDTLYVIFQCSGNTQGHFANYNSSPGLRTLTMSFSSPGGCSDVVTYERSNMINQSGGSGGPSSGNDGGTVEFNWAGTPSYINNGCTAPIEINTIDINETGFTICPGDTIDLSASIVGSFPSTTWTGGNGSFSSNSNATTSYYSNTTDISDFYIYYEGTTTCSNPVKDSVLVQIGGNTSSVNITPPSTTELCNGDSILISVTGSGNYLWSTGSSSSSIYALSSGAYSVTSTSTCGSSTDSIIITDSPTINLNLTTSNTELCNGAPTVLTASGAPNYTWFNNSIGTTETVNVAGDYYVIGYNNCYTDSQSVTITTNSTPSISISSSSLNDTICSGETIDLTASGSDNYLWNTTSISSTISVNSSGTYSVSSTNNCGTTNEQLIIYDGLLPSVTITGDTILCNNTPSVQLTANSASPIMWSNNNSSTTQSFNTQGPVYVVATNSCGTDTAHRIIVDHSIIASFTSDFSSENEIPSTINFTNTSSGNIIDIIWDFGNGLSSTITSPSTIYTENGEYIVTLTSSNQFCSSVAQEVILFERDNTVFIPNIFTPNNDNLNDFFLIKGENISAIDCKIFNRWGQEIYSWDTLDGSWDGYSDGILSADGTYFYISNISWNNSDREVLTGHVTLLK